MLPELLAAPLRCQLLLPARDRTIGILNLDHEIRDRKLQLVRPESAGFVARGEFQARAEIEQDIRRLGDDESCIKRLGLPRHLSKCMRVRTEALKCAFSKKVGPRTGSCNGSTS